MLPEAPRTMWRWSCKVLATAHAIKARFVKVIFVMHIQEFNVNLFTILWKRPINKYSINIYGRPNIIMYRTGTSPWVRIKLEFSQIYDVQSCDLWWTFKRSSYSLFNHHITILWSHYVLHQLVIFYYFSCLVEKTLFTYSFL